MNSYQFLKIERNNYMDKYLGQDTPTAAEKFCDVLERNSKDKV